MTPFRIGYPGGKNFLDYRVGKYWLRQHLNLTRVCALYVHSTFASQMLLQAPSEFGEERVPLFVCEECGDVGCGAVTVRVIQHGECVTWSDFGFQAPGSEFFEQSEYMRRTGPFEFDATAYREAIQPYAATGSPQH